MNFLPEYLLGMIVGALSITWLLTRIAKKLLQKKYAPQKAAILSFVLVGLLSLSLSTYFNSLYQKSLLEGFVKGFVFYIPCLLLWLAIDIINTRRENRYD